MYGIYETGLMNVDKLRKFANWLDKKIGTEYEMNFEDGNKGYIVVFDLLPNEVIKIRNKENQE
jgi:hypothetical protein